MIIIESEVIHETIELKKIVVFQSFAKISFF